MKQLLQAQGYQLNEHQVWQRPEFTGIAYSDGDEIENRIWDAIKATPDRTVFSVDLKRHCTDWPSLYHLSGVRANLMRPLKNVFQGDILEIGAGCGAISRYLGECTAGTDSRLLALEGSPRRAAIARARTQELDHVTVLTEQFDNFRPEKQFDVVTLIGVLEYANLFTGGPTAALSMLKRARQLVKPGGHLVIAIENQLGLKYFAGAPEDHVGIAMYGIEARYGEKQAKTFGRKALQNLLKDSGFAYNAFFSPVPDYKLPVSVISEEGMASQEFDASALAWQSVRKDPQLPAALHFSPELAWPDIFANGLGMELSNSFLVLTSDDLILPVEPHVLAWHYSTDRLPAFCKETRFVCGADQKVEVSYLPLGNSAVSTSGPLHYAPGAHAHYATGTCLSLRFIRALSQDGWTNQQLSDLLAIYLQVLRREADRAEQTQREWTADTRLPGHLFDAVPHNVIETEPANFVVIDTEWTLREGIEVGQLLFRATLLLLSGLARMGAPADPSIKTRRDFVSLVMTCVGLSATETQMQAWMQHEAHIQATVTGQAIEGFLDWHPERALNTQSLSQANFDRMEQLSRSHFDLAQHHERLLVQALERKQAIEASTSWRLTAPLRALLSRLRR